MVKEMIVNTTALETKVAILEDDQLAELYIERNRNRGILGNIYKGKVTKVLPGMQSAFVNIGLDKDAFLYVSDFIEDSEEYDKVLTAAEEQVAKAMAELDVQERPQRRDRKGERSRWRERRERHELPRPAPPPPPEPALLEKWVLGCETENLVSASPEGSDAKEPQIIPAPVALVPFISSSPPAGAEPLVEDAAKPVLTLPTESPVEPASDDLPPMESARLTDRDETMAFTEGEGAPRSGFSARRRGPAARRKRYTAARHTKRPEHQSIDDVLREGQEILVQIAKEPIGKKGARVTSHIALPGRYLVYMPTVDHVGVSRKIGSDAERIRLKDIILKHRELFSGGIIVRTAAEERREEDLANDLKFLVRLWDDIRGKAEKASAPALIHAELNLVQRILRDHFSFEFQAVRVDDEAEYQRIVEFVDKIYHNMVHRVKLYTRERPIFDEFGINPEIDKLLQPKIWLKSGGYIVINQTEALVSIDINTGKFVGKGNDNADQPGGGEGNRQADPAQGPGRNHRYRFHRYGRAEEPQEGHGGALTGTGQRQSAEQDPRVQ
jgi:ribonuclease G